MVEPNREKRLIVVIDPMCSWCWGFAPVHRKIHQDYQDKASISVLTGGLRAGTQTITPTHLKETILHHWHQVAATTKQAFQFHFPDNLIYDTEPACRAVVVIREHYPAKLLDYIELVQKQFYVENQDITQAAQLGDCANRLGLNRDEFLTHFHSKQIKEITKADFQQAFEYEATGFPTVLASFEQGFFPLVIGYDEFDNIKLKIDRWLSR